MDDLLLENLLYQEESATLDFKEGQYPFAKATAEQKSELLKDILAFANAWRQTDAHILIGVRDVKGGRSTVVGIPPGDQLNDHSLQQFVCGKTNRPIPFSYQPFATGGVEIGVLTIAIPEQRPFYLNADFGKLQKNAVYIRRGSSTGEAQPDEVLRMAANSVLPAGQPVLELQLCDPESHRTFGNTVELQPVIFELPEPSSLPSFGRAQHDSAMGISIPTGSFDNNYYYEHIADYLKERFVFCPVGVAITNSSQTLADTVLVTMELASDGPVRLADEGDMPVMPSTSQINPIALRAAPSRQIDVEHYDGTYEGKIRIGNVQPGRTEYSSEPFYVASEEARNISMKVTISANNLRIPITTSVEIKLSPVNKRLSVKDVVQYGKANR